jgi:acyl-CoA thioester hydrolase
MSEDFERPYSGKFVGQTHQYALRVYIEDTDIGGVVYYANYLRFLERARSDMLSCLGIDQRAAIESGVGVYAVAEVRIKYCKPERLQDALIILSRIEGIGGASVVIQQTIVRGQETLAKATVTAAFLNSQGRPSRQPADWVKKFSDLAGDKAGG